MVLFRKSFKAGNILSGASTNPMWPVLSSKMASACSGSANMGRIFSSGIRESCLPITKKYELHPQQSENLPAKDFIFTR